MIPSLVAKLRVLKIEHWLNIEHYAECLENNCSEDYICETGQWFKERVIEHKGGQWLNECVIHHNGRDSNLYIFQHAVEKDSRIPTINELEIIERSYKNATFKRKITEWLLIKNIRPGLNSHEKSVPLKLFSWKNQHFIAFYTSFNICTLCNHNSYFSKIFLYSFM